jgi:hypothetical protein
MAISPFNYKDLTRMMIDFDQDKFKTPISTPISYARQTIVIHQLENNLHALFSVEIVDQIARYCFDDAPSVQALWKYYIGSPQVASKYHLLLPLSNQLLLNSASKILLLKLRQKLSEEKHALGYFKQLMTCVFRHHFQKLNPSQKLLLLQKIPMTPWEQKSSDEKLKLFGRMQQLAGWSHPKIKFQFLVWKMRFAAARVLKADVLLWSLAVPFLTLGTMYFINLVFSGFRWINSVTFKNQKTEVFFDALVTTLSTGIWIGIIGGAILTSCGTAFSLLFAGLGKILALRYLPAHIQEKGTWIQSVSWNCFQLNLNCFCIIASFLPSFGPRDQRLNDEWHANIKKALNELNRQLKESINEEKIPVEQEKFIEAQIPDLLEKWHFLISEKFLPNGINTGS